MSISISLTSTSIQEHDEYNSEQLLNKTNCLNASYAINSVHWFQVNSLYYLLKLCFVSNIQTQVSTRKYASALIRCLRYRTNVSQRWQSLSSEV